MTIRERVSLKDEHTFHMPVTARFFVEIQSVSELQELIASSIYRENESIIIGRGSNILFAGDFSGVVMKMNIRGIAIIADDDDSVLVQAGAGEDWHPFVMHMVESGYGGIENLALIPGTVGAAPVQNIGAYGQNFADVFESLEAVELETGLITTFSKNDCRFGYRTSFFKESGRGAYAIISVRMRLRKHPKLELSYTSRYESLVGELETFAREPYSVKDVAQAVINIRTRKLPDPAIVGNAGSFFKNPVVSKEKIIALQKELPGLPFYPANAWSSASRTIADEPDDALFKIPAAWLLEDMGWKGKRVGDCGTWPTQPLSIVNYGAATPKDLLVFIELVRNAMRDRYGIALENEVEIVGQTML